MGHTASRGRSFPTRLVLLSGLVLMVSLLGCAAAPTDGGEDDAPADYSTRADDHQEPPAITPARDGEKFGEAGEAGDADPVDVDSLVATATVDEVVVRDAADPDAKVTHRLAHPTPVGAPRVFLVEEQVGDWLKVFLPVRPNGSVGWIARDDVVLRRTPYRVDVHLDDHRLVIHRGEQLVLDAEIGYGAEDTPTPGGRYYLTELLRPPEPDGPYGPYAFGISGFSDVHLDFAGGEGVIGIHGTDDPSSIGARVSAGCIRVHNEVITEMAGFLPLGTPVTILGSR